MSGFQIFLICILVIFLLPAFLVSSAFSSTAGTATGSSNQSQDFTCGEHSGFSCADASGTDNCTCQPSS